MTSGLKTRLLTSCARDRGYSEGSSELVSRFIPTPYAVSEPGPFVCTMPKSSLKASRRAQQLHAALSLRHAGVKRSHEDAGAFSAAATLAAFATAAVLVASPMAFDDSESPVVAPAVAFDGVEFNSSSEEWLKDVVTGEDGVVELSWSPDAGRNLRGPYRGDSKSTIRRRRVAAEEEAESREKEAAGDKAAHRKQTKMSAFFAPVEQAPSPDAADAVAAAAGGAANVSSSLEHDYEDSTPDVLSVDECLEQIESTQLALFSANKKYNVNTNYDHLRFLMVYRYFTLRCGNDTAEPLGKMEASLQASAIVPPFTPRDYLSRCIRVWADYYALCQELPPRRQGAHAKIKSFIDDADNNNMLLTLLRSMPRNTRSAENFARAVNEKFPQLSICPRTASEWMHRLKFHPGGLHSTVYKDGHERPDVKVDRSIFIDTMQSLFPRMPIFEGPDLLTVTEPHALRTGVGATGPGFDDRPLIWFVHDESICDSSGGRKTPWIEEGHPPMQPKRGESIMISRFLSPWGMSPLDYVTMEPGINKDGYWTNRHLIAQLHSWLPTLATRFPGKQIVVQFDNSRNHGVYAPDALYASRLNLSDGYPELTASDKAAGMESAAFRNTTWVDGFGVTHLQSFLYTDGTMDAKDPSRPAHKGIKTILKERGLWRESYDPAREYRLPPTAPLGAGEFGPERPAGVATVIRKGRMLLAEALQLLEQQPDFIAQRRKNWVTEVVESYGHIAVFNAKFHPELAPIEYFWGQMKKFLRCRCDYTMATLRATLPLAIASVSLTTIRRHYAHVCRYMKAYSDQSLSLCQIEWAMRKYSSHRRAKEPPADLDTQFLTPAWFDNMPAKLRGE